MNYQNTNQVIISVYHVVDSADRHRFITTNDRFIERVGGVPALEERLRKQFRSFELMGTCTAAPSEEASETAFDESAAAAIFDRIRAIQQKFPDCDPLPRAWSEGEQCLMQKEEIAAALGLTNPLQQKLVPELMELLRTVPEIDTVVALISHKGIAKAGVVFHHTREAGFFFERGGAPANMHMMLVPDPDEDGTRWRVLPEKLLRFPECPASETVVVAYFLTSKQRMAIALSPRYGGSFSWVGNEDVIAGIADALSEVGILTRTGQGS